MSELNRNICVFRPQCLNGVRRIVLQPDLLRRFRVIRPEPDIG